LDPFVRQILQKPASEISGVQSEANQRIMTADMT